MSLYFFGCLAHWKAVFSSFSPSASSDRFLTGAAEGPPAGDDVAGLPLTPLARVFGDCGRTAAAATEAADLATAAAVSARDCSLAITFAFTVVDFFFFLLNSELSFALSSAMAIVIPSALLLLWCWPKATGCVLRPKTKRSLG